MSGGVRRSQTGRQSRPPVCPLGSSTKSISFDANARNSLWSCSKSRWVQYPVSSSTSCQLTPRASRSLAKSQIAAWKPGPVELVFCESRMERPRISKKTSSAVGCALHRNVCSSASFPSWGPDTLAEPNAPKYDLHSSLRCSGSVRATWADIVPSRAIPTDMA